MTDSNDNHSDFRLDDDGFPMPCLPDLDYFTVKDYQSEGYAATRTVEEAIAMRGHKAFFDNVRPEDFDSGPRANARKVGIAELWSQSTWSAAEKDSRNVGSEYLAAGISEGDVITVCGVPTNLSETENWEETRELGFGFCLGNELLPFTPYHDYDQDFFMKVIEALRPGEHIECIVRSSACYGQNGVDNDPDFCWRVYSCEVTVLIVSDR